LVGPTTPASGAKSGTGAGSLGTDRSVQVTSFKGDSYMMRLEGRSATENAKRHDSSCKLPEIKPDAVD